VINNTFDELEIIMDTSAINEGTLAVRNQFIQMWSEPIG
jgi:hypothetical protein